jgi:hypothetical protein
MQEQLPIRAFVLAFVGLAGLVPIARSQQPKLSLPPGMQSPAGDRQLTWAEVENVLQKCRDGRTQSHSEKARLAHNYGVLASPSFSGSVNHPQHLTVLAEWHDEMPMSPTALVVMAKAHIAQAWKVRGKGLAISVADEAWPVFRANIADARRLLEEAVKLQAKDGEAYYLLIEVAKTEGLPLEQARAWLDEGRKVDPTYFWMYTTMAEYLLPRWHGQPGDVEKFALEMAKSLPGEDGLEIYAQIAYQVNKYDYYASKILRAEYDRAQLLKGAEILVDRYPEWRQSKQFAALCAVAAQDHEAALRILPAVGDYKEEDRIWPWENSFTFDYLAWCRAKRVPRGESKWVWGTHFPSDTEMAFTLDSRNIWCGHSGGMSAASLIDVDTGREVDSITSHGDGLGHLVFDMDRNWILGATWEEEPFRGVILWDPEQTEPLALVPTKELAGAIAINPK